MTMYKNDLGQIIGFPLPEWQGAKKPSRTRLKGSYCNLEPLSIETHAEDLYEAYAKDKDLKNWTYLLAGPFENFQSYINYLKTDCCSENPLFFSVIDKTTNKAIGVASFMRMKPEMGVIEVGSIHFSPSLQRTLLSTEAMYLMMEHVFDDLRYRRYEWKCDSLNQPSINAAERLGFTYEGTFRQAVVSKGRNRDTAWFSIIDEEWPRLKAAFKDWLDPSNFNTDGKQKNSLRQFQQKYKLNGEKNRKKWGGVF